MSIPSAPVPVPRTGWHWDWRVFFIGAMLASTLQTIAHWLTQLPLVQRLYRRFIWFKARAPWLQSSSVQGTAAWNRHGSPRLI